MRGQITSPSETSKSSCDIHSEAAATISSPTMIIFRASAPRDSMIPITGISSIVTKPAGERTSPACVAEYPISVCSICGSRTVVAYSVA